MIYDTQEVRRVAARLQAISDETTASMSGSLRRTADELPLHFKGEAAEQLKSSLSNLFLDVHTAANNLERLSQMLYNYARLLDAADLKAKQYIERE